MRRKALQVGIAVIAIFVVYAGYAIRRDLNRIDANNRQQLELEKWAAGEEMSDAFAVGDQAAVKRAHAKFADKVRQLREYN